ncbi:MAG TPA: ABC transporter permease, partial [Bryobacteraceae bacterium]|nr:ABC transporter permease [Bryobacteraceae bacterium]
MRLTKIVRLRLRSLVSRAKVEEELDEELRYHLERQMEEDMAAGMSREEARRAALRSFAGVDLRKEECRDARGWNLADGIAQDLRFALRQLGKNPGFTATAVLMLALGLCASVAIFAFVDAILVQPLPYRQPSRLVGVYEAIPTCPKCNLSYFDYLDWKRMNKVFTALEAYNDTGFIVTTPEGAEPARAVRVSDGFLCVLGVAPVLGRDFRAGEDQPGAPRTVILSFAAWQKRYGGKPDAIGRTVVLDGEPYVIIGVLPASFHFAPAGTAEFWATIDTKEYCEQRRGCHNLYGVARLKNGVSVASAMADTRLIAQQLATQYPDTNRGQGAMVVSLADAIVGDVRPILWALLGGAGLLLLIAFTNIASLLLVRSESRRREMAVRTALGAASGRLIRQFLTEGLVVVVAGAALGLAAAAWGIGILTRLIPKGIMDHMPFVQALGLNLHTMAFAAVISLAAVFLFAITPAVRLSFGEMRAGLAEGSRGSAGNTWRRLGSRLVVAELATAMVLLVGAGLLGQSLYRLLHVELGFRPDHLAAVVVAAPDKSYPKAQIVRLEREVLGRISSLPGVQSAAVTNTLPVSFSGPIGNTIWIRFVGRPYDGEHNEVNWRLAGSGYFKTIGAKLLRGRYFNEGEDRSQPRVSIINRALAEKYFPGEDPIGKQIGDPDLAPDSITRIVGVVENIREGSLDSEIWPTQYVPFNQDPETFFSVVARTSQDERSTLPAMA